MGSTPIDDICRSGAMAAHLFCKQAVVGSNPTFGSIAADKETILLRGIARALSVASFRWGTWQVANAHCG